MIKKSSKMMVTMNNELVKIERTGWNKKVDFMDNVLPILTLV